MKQARCPHCTKPVPPAGPVNVVVTGQGPTRRVTFCHPACGPASPSIDDLPPGEQPEQGGRLLCRYCGRWYRSLGHHLRIGHGIDPDMYREHFELPATRALMATDLRERQSERGRHLLATNETVRIAFAVDDPDNAERRERQSRGVRRKAETEPRAGVQRGKRVVGDILGRNSQARAAQRRQGNNEIARRRGYRSFVDLLQQNRHLTDPDLGRLLGWTAAKARWWRNEHGSQGQARTVAAQARTARQRAGLELVTRGTQPQRDDGMLRCLVCGLWRDDLSQHITRGHKLTVAQYRTIYDLPAELPLQSQARRRDHAKLAGQARHAGDTAGRAISDRARTKWDTAAGNHGYPDIPAMLQANTDRQIATAFGLRRVSDASKLRRRYLPTDPPPS